jgi:hypothetical protein
MVATVVARNANEAMVAPMAGSGGECVWREVWNLESVCRLCVGVFA